MKYYKHVYIYLFIVIVVTGCGGTLARMSGIPVIDPGDSYAVATNTEISRDRHQNILKVTGPLIFAEDNILGDTYFLRGWKNLNNPELNNDVQIYISAKFSDWAYLDSAYSYGKRLDVTKIDSDVDCYSSGCTHTETIGINLSEEQIQNAMRSGFSFKVTGTGGSTSLSIPAAYFSGFQQVFKRAE